MLVEAVNERGDATWGLYSVVSEYVGRVEGQFIYHGQLRTVPVEPSDSAIAGTLNAVETGDAKNVSGFRYDKTFKMQFESTQEPQELSVYASVGSDIGDYRPGDDRASLYEQRLGVVDDDLTEALGMTRCMASAATIFCVVGTMTIFYRGKDRDIFGFGDDENTDTVTD